MSISIEDLKKRYGTIVSTANTPIPRHYYKFSAPTLNWLVSGGRDFRGMRSGAVLELVGAKSSGKSTTALDLIGNAMRDGKQCFWIAIERWLDNETVGDYANTMGIDLSQLPVARPKTTEDAFTLAEKVIGDGFNVVVIDSIAAAIPKDEWDKQYDDNERMGEMAKLVKRFIQRAGILAYDSNTLIVALNQVRANVTSMPGAKALKRFGGEAYKHALDVSLELTVTGKEGDAQKVSVFSEWNRLGGAAKLKREILMEHGKGIRVDIDVVRWGVETGVIEKKGAWYRFQDVKAQGEDNAALELPINDIRKALDSVSV